MLTSYKVVTAIAMCSFLNGTGAFATPAPDLVVESNLTVQVEYVATMPFVDGPGGVPSNPEPNLNSPVPIRNRLYLIDQNDAIYRMSKKGRFIKKIFSVDEAPDGLTLDNRRSILNISPGRRKHSIYVMFTSGSEPTTSIPVYRLPAPLPGDCCFPNDPLRLDDLYRVGPIPGPFAFLGATRTEYQVLYEYRLAGKKLRHPRAIAAFESQSIVAPEGGGMLTLPDGRVLFATGDGLPFGSDGGAAPQDSTSYLSKLLIIDPSNGSIEIAAQGIRNVQHLEFIPGPDPHRIAVGFADIGGVTAEEINYVLLEDLLDTQVIENFGWGRNVDGKAREGTFYIKPGLTLITGTEPPVDTNAPSPEAGFIQPNAQYGRNDPNGGLAASGPVTSKRSFSSIKAVFSDLPRGILYATTESITATNVPVLRVNMIDENELPLDSFLDLVTGDRAEPRMFRFPDGTAGVLLETMGDIYRLTEVDTD